MKFPVPTPARNEQELIEDCLEKIDSRFCNPILIANAYDDLTAK